MKKIIVYALLIVSLQNAPLQSAIGCMKYGAGFAGQTLQPVECYCQCDRHSHGVSKRCDECRHFRAPRVFQIKSKSKKQS